MPAEPVYELWGQESDLKGLRIIKFEVLQSHMLKWIGPYEGPPDPIYLNAVSHRDVLTANGWVKLT